MSGPLILPEFVPDARLSLNGVRRTHWRVLQRLRNETQWHVREALGSDRGRELVAAGPLAHAQLRIEFVFPQHRRRDEDGLAGRCKPILDALVDGGVLEADDSDHLHLQVTARVERGTRETRLHLTREEGL